MRRPLQELPLHQFLPAMQDIKSGLNNKRPLSPGTAVISPAKRRNLAGQNMLSPEQIFKSPPSSLRKSIVAASRFGDVLSGPQSPARILDFGLPKHLAGDPEKRPVSEFSVDDDVDLTPTRRHPSSSRLAASPELKPRTRQTEVDDVVTGSLPCRPSPSSRCSYTLIPRELPPRTDPHSVHYPGFVVYQDPHIAAYNSLPRDDECEVEDDEESWKENSRVAFTKNLATPRSSSFPKAFLDGDKIAPSSKFKAASSVRAPHSNAAESSSAAPSEKHVQTPLEARRNLRRALLDELDLEEDCIVEE